nr:hypothetical protein [Micromonospora purpureochromogenes]
MSAPPDRVRRRGAARRTDPPFPVPLRPGLPAAPGAARGTARHGLGRLGPDGLLVRFGPWLLRTTRDNVTGAELSGPYRWWRAIGPHLSAADGGVTFGAGVAAGVCLRFAEPVPALAPGPWPRHPAVTVTVADPAALRDAVTAGAPDL